MVGQEGDLDPALPPMRCKSHQGSRPVAFPTHSIFHLPPKLCLATALSAMPPTIPQLSDSISLRRVMEVSTSEWEEKRMSPET